MSERLTALALATALPLLSFPQDLLPTGATAQQDRVEVRGAFDYDANTLLNELVLDLTQGGFVERDVRERSQAALRSNNRLGQVLQLGVHAVFGDSILGRAGLKVMILSLIPISEPPRPYLISFAVFCFQKNKPHLSTCTH